MKVYLLKTGRDTFPDLVVVSDEPTMRLPTLPKGTVWIWSRQRLQPIDDPSISIQRIIASYEERGYYLVRTKKTFLDRFKDLLGRKKAPGR